MFDLAGVTSNAGFTEEASLAFLTSYLEAAPNQTFLRAFSAMQCASLLREAMWSMVSEIHSDLDFDFAAYTEITRATWMAAMNDLKEID